jgi:nucleoid-associated protein YgaU
MLLIGLMQGCAAKERSTEHYTIRSYIQEKERVDQEIDVQNKVGNWENSPNAVNPERKATRKIYVLEVTEKMKDIDEQIGEMSVTEDMAGADSTGTITTKEVSQKVYEVPPIDLPSFDETKAPAPAPAAVTSATTYTVEKDDTLQKISKKFYNSYSQWTKIYEANKDKIPNPNFIKPGTVIVIPASGTK